MIFLYLTLICFIAGILTWITGTVVHKQKNRANPSKRKKYQQLSENLGTAAKILFIITALFFVLAFIMIQGFQNQ